MRVAALFDIHGNLPALEAVLEEVERENVDRIVVGGDAILGPMPRETLQRLLVFERLVQFIHGNCELAVLALMRAKDEAAVTYWGTSSGAPMSEEYRPDFRWNAQQLTEYETVMASWPKTLRLDIDGLGSVVFCHGTPRSETEIFTRLSPESALLPIFAPFDGSLVVCGHTHMPFDRMIGATRVVNPGSVGSPFGAPGAYWALLGPGVDLRRTVYDFERAAERVRATALPTAEKFADEVLRPRAAEPMLDLFTKAGVK